MRNHMEILRIIAEHDTPAFSQPLQWYSNGMRGHLHASRICDNQKGWDIETRLFTLKDALTIKKICEKCDRGLVKTPEQQQVYDSVESLDTIAQTVSNLVGHRINNEGGLPLLTRWRNVQICKTLADDLAKINTVNSGLEAWKLKIENALHVHLIEPVQCEALNKEVIHWAAISVLRNQISKGDLAPEIWGGPTVTGLFGLPEYGDFGERDKPLVLLAKLLVAWTGLLEKGETPSEAAELIINNSDVVKSIIGDADKRAMQYIFATEPPDINEKMWDYVQRVWHVRAVSALRRALATWAKMLAALEADAPQILLGVERVDAETVATLAYSSGIDAILVSSLQWILPHGAGDETGLGAIICHPTVGKFIDRSSELHLTVSLYRAVQLEGIPTRETIENTLKLWEPQDTDMTYNVLETAYNAAKLL